MLRVIGVRDASGRLVEHQDPVTGVGFYSGRADAERSMLLDCIATGEALYVHDLAGGLLSDLTKIVDNGEGLDGLLAAFALHGYRVTILHLISPDVAATESVAKWLALTGRGADHIAVINLRHGKPQMDFPFWYGFEQSGVRKGGKTRQRLLDAGGLEVTFPGLPAGTFAKLDSENVAFSRAAEAGLLTISERAHVAKFLADFGAAFVPVWSLLGLSV